MSTLNDVEQKYKIAVDFLESFKPIISLTRDGAPAIVCTDKSGSQTHPLLGVFWDGDSWIPVRWGVNGMFMITGDKSGMDVLLENKAMA